MAQAETEPTRRKRKANREHLTETKVRSLRVKAHQHFVWDAGTGAARGLAVLVNPLGTKTYFVNYRLDGRLTYKKLGRVGEIGLEEARSAALEARKLAKQDIDPKGDSPSKSNSFEKAWEDYIQQEQIGRKNNVSALETQSFVLNACAELKPRHVATITYRQIDALLAGIRDGNPQEGIKGRPSAAARIHSHLRNFFNWCARRRTMKENPMANMPTPFKGAPMDRYYSDDEITAIWKAAEQLDPVECGYVKLILLLATRRDELAEAKWAEFDNPDRPTIFTVPTERVKMKAETKRLKRPVYIVPLPPLAQRILKGFKRDGDIVFPGP